MNFADLPPEVVIDDHPHAWVMSGRWRASRCAVCGERVQRHQSWKDDLEAALNRAARGATDE